MVTRIAELVSEKQIEGIRDLRDESDENTRIVVELKRGEQAKVVINQLFQRTALESSFGVTLLAIDRKRPKQMNVKELIECYLAHRREVVTRRTQFRLKQAEDRAHILEGYKIALDNLDDFVRIIRGSDSREEAKLRLLAKYPLSDRQADAILELRLYQLTGLERDKIESEYLDLLKLVEELRGILESSAKLHALIKQELLAIKAKYTSPRRTEIVAAAGEFRMEDVIPNQGCVITASHLGFIKRTRVADYRSQRRGGKGIIGTENGYGEGSLPRHLFTASTHDYILFFTNTGQCHAKESIRRPGGHPRFEGAVPSSRESFLRLAEGEQIAAMICVKDFASPLQLVMATHRGMVKKTDLPEYDAATREGGLRGIRLNQGDALVGCVLTSGADEIILISHKGQAVRFQEGPVAGGEPAPGEEAEAEAGEKREGLRAMGRVTAGVTGMRFKYDGDYVQAIEVCDPEARLLIAREDGIGKRTPFADYRLTRRGGCWCDRDRTAGGRLGQRRCGTPSACGEDDEIMLLTAKGQSIRTRVSEIRETGRGAKGVKLLTLAEGDRLLTIARIVETDEETAVGS